MEALFSSGVTALKLEYLISHANTFGAKCIGKSCGFKTWEKIHCGCYISSPGYVMTTEEKKMNCALQLPLLGFDCCHTTNRDTMTGHFILTTLSFYFFYVFHQSQKKGMFISLPCRIPLWVIALNPVPMNNQFSHSLEEAELTATLITACSCFRYPSKKQGKKSSGKKQRSPFYFEPPKIWAMLFLEFQNKIETFVLVH